MHISMYFDHKCWPKLLKKRKIMLANFYAPHPKTEYFQAQATKAQTDLMAKARQNAELKLDLSKVSF